MLYMTESYMHLIRWAKFDDKNFRRKILELKKNNFFFYINKNWNYTIYYDLNLFSVSQIKISSYIF